MADKYTITDQQEIMDLAADGTPVRSMAISFVTKPSGVPSSVRVPIAKYTADAVAAAINPFADELEAAHTA